MQGLKDPEAKRKAIGAGFIEVFNDFAAHFDKKPKYLVQVCDVKLAATLLWHARHRRVFCMNGSAVVLVHACKCCPHASLPAAGNSVS